MNCTLGSMTQMLAPRMSRIWLAVSRIRPQKIDACCEMSSDGEADAQDHAEILAGIADQHAKGDPVHGAKARRVEAHGELPSRSGVARLHCTGEMI